MSPTQYAFIRLHLTSLVGDDVVFALANDGVALFEDRVSVCLKKNAISNQSHRLFSLRWAMGIL